MTSCTTELKSLCKVFYLNGPQTAKHTKVARRLATDVEYIVVLTDSVSHTKVAADCLRAGKNVLITKPWALDSKDAAFIIDEAKKAKAKYRGKPHAVPAAELGHRLEYHQEIIDSGDIGQVYMIRRRAGTFGKRYDWQIYKEFGGGYLNNWGPHLLGQLLALVDEPVQVFAEKDR